MVLQNYKCRSILSSEQGPYIQSLFVCAFLVDSYQTMTNLSPDASMPLKYHIIRDFNILTQTNGRKIGLLCLHCTST